MLLYAIRHGDPIYSPVEGLTPQGTVQAEALADRLEKSGLTRIYSSPLNRARQTAAPTAQRLGLEVHIEPWCNENLAWKEFTHPSPAGSVEWCMFQSNTNFRSESNFNRGNADWSRCDCLADTASPVERSYARIIAASDDFLARLGYRREQHIYRAERPNDDRVALFCHQGFLMVWTPFLLGIPPHLFWSSFNVTHTGVAVFEFANTADGRCAPRCLLWSDTSHLFKAGLSLNYNNRIAL